MDASLKELKKAKRDLEEQHNANRLSELDELISEIGLNYDEMREILIME